MIRPLQKISSSITRMQEIPVSFFSAIEETEAFGDHLFPEWFPRVFGNPLRNKFETIYINYKSVACSFTRQKITEAFIHGNLIESLCNNDIGTSCITITDLPETIREPIKSALIHLYNALDNDLYQQEVGEALEDVLERFNTTNQTEICPFCGIEGFINVEGEPRQTLDHWLYKDNYPFAAANFDNLMPIGDKCNRRPAKGTKDVLYNGAVRSAAFYPYKAHSGITISFRFINEPTSTNITDNDWELIVAPNEPQEQVIFDNWNSTFNIIKRYKGFLRKRVFPKWENDYLEYINDNDHDLRPANTLDEFYHNLRNWRATFRIKYDDRAIIYRAFIDYLTENASEEYLTGLYENFLTLSKCLSVRRL